MFSAGLRLLLFPEDAEPQTPTLNDQVQAQTSLFQFVLLLLQ